MIYSQSTDRTVTKQRFDKIFPEAQVKAATPANTKAGLGATSFYTLNPSIIPHEAFASSLVTQNEDAQVSNIMTVFETPAAVPLPQKMTRKASPLPGTSSRVAPSASNPDVVFL